MSALLIRIKEGLPVTGNGQTGPIREVVDLPKAISFVAGEKRLVDAMRLGATSTPQRNVEISKQGVRGEHDINPLDPMQTQEIHEAKSRRKRRDRSESKGMKMGEQSSTVVYGWSFS